MILNGLDDFDDTSYSSFCFRGFSSIIYEVIECLDMHTKSFRFLPKKVLDDDVLFELWTIIKYLILKNVKDYKENARSEN